MLLLISSLFGWRGKKLRIGKKTVYFSTSDFDSDKEEGWNNGPRHCFFLLGRGDGIILNSFCHRSMEGRKFRRTRLLVRCSFFFLLRILEKVMLPDSYVVSKRQF